jgi:hypothetical protein
MAKSSLEKMKERLKKSSPKISGRANLENMNQIKNFMFGKKKGMGTEDDVFGTSLVGVNKKIKKNNSTSTKKSKVDVGLSEALKKQKNKKKPLGMSPGALGGKTTPTVKKDKKIAPIVKKDKKIVKNAPKTGSKTKVKATAGNTKDFAKTMAMQKKLIKMGAKIKADGIMGTKTRAAMAKFMKPGALPKSRPTKNSGVSQGSTMAKVRGKTGYGSKAMSTKTPKKYKGTNITPTKLQKERMRKRMMGST